MPDELLILHGEPVPQNGELSKTSAANEASMTIQAAVLMARQFPRNEDAVYAALMKACERYRFADAASYAFPRGKRKDPQSGRWVDNIISGASIKLAREVKRLWGNMRTGLEVVFDERGDGTVENPGLRKIRGWAWDLQTNTYESFEDSFLKLIQRRVGHGEGRTTAWVVPDERDLRELTFRRGAICVRNAVLALVPSDFVDDARDAASETILKEVTSDPDAEKKKVIVGFSQLNITPEMLEKFLGHALARCSPPQIVKLRQIWLSVRDGNTTWEDYVQGATETKEEDRVTADKVPTSPSGTAVSVRDEQKPKAEAKNDGVEPEWERISPVQLKELRRLITKNPGMTEVKLASAVGMEGVAIKDLPADVFDAAKTLMA